MKKTFPRDTSIHETLRYLKDTPSLRIEFPPNWGSAVCSNFRMLNGAWLSSSNPTKDRIKKDFIVTFIRKRGKVFHW